MDNIFSFFAQNISTLGDPYRRSNWGSDILDKASIDFFRTFNGAYFFDNSLHFFRVGYKSVGFHDTELINEIIGHYYSDFMDESIFFAEDILETFLALSPLAVSYYLILNLLKKKLFQKDFLII